jgi:hypothetical protein
MQCTLINYGSPQIRPCLLTIAVLHHKVEALGVLQHLQHQKAKTLLVGIVGNHLLASVANSEASATWRSTALCVVVRVLHSVASLLAHEQNKQCCKSLGRVACMHASQS